MRGRFRSRVSFLFPLNTYFVLEYIRKYEKKQHDTKSPAAMLTVVAHGLCLGWSNCSEASIPVRNTLRSLFACVNKFPDALHMPRGFATNRPAQKGNQVRDDLHRNRLNGHQGGVQISLIRTSGFQLGNRLPQQSLREEQGGHPELSVTAYRTKRARKNST